MIFCKTEVIFRKMFVRTKHWNWFSVKRIPCAAKHLNTFSFPENSISGKWNIFRKCFYATKRSLSILPFFSHKCRFSMKFNCSCIWGHVILSHAGGISSVPLRFFFFLKSLGNNHGVKSNEKLFPMGLISFKFQQIYCSSCLCCYLCMCACGYNDCLWH